MPATAVIFLFNVLETKVLRESLSSEFSHGLGHKRKSGSPVPSRKQEEALQAALLAALRVRNGKTVVGEGSPAKWQLKEAVS
jgi:hypothetical protein